MMKKRWMFRLLSFVCLFLLSVNCFAGHGDKPPVKKAILLAAFGTTVPEAQKALDNIDVMAGQAFPDVEIRWAYTSKIIRKKLAKQGKVLDSPETALSKLMDDGYTHVAVLPLHTIPGEEFHELYQNAHLYGQMAGGFQQILVALPLLSSHEDMVRVANAMIKHIPVDRKADEAVLLMGHGTAHHPSDAIYLAMNQVFQESDPNIFVGTVEGYPTINDVLPKLRERKIKKVYLMPFMAVAGDHARNDMAGEEPDSWKSILEKNGYSCETVLKGTGEYPEVVEVWLDHLRSAYSHF
ncbi:MAG: sirohydrochlorin cobaltochelatase [Desulfoferrobacter sp.]